MHLSYVYMIKELYTRDKSPTCYHPTDPSCTGDFPGRPASAVLVAASFIWPHIKLLLLHFAFYARLHAFARRNLSFWLSFFGKWTLTDVLVWCACVAVFHGLQINDGLLALWRKVEADGLHLCAALCANQTHIPNCTQACDALDHALDASVLSPADLPSSSAYIRLAFNTRMGTYLFCVAVVLSLSCSVIVDALEDRHLLPARHGLDGGRDGHPGDANGSARVHEGRGGHTERYTSEAARPVAGSGTINDALVLPSLATGEARSARPRWVLHILGVMLQLWLTFCAVTLPLFRRHVGGGIPAALRSRGFDFDGSYSVVDLARLAGAPGGWDYLLSATFWLFVIICPVLRGLTELALLLAPMKHATAVLVHRVSRALSYYYAHEVMLIGVPLLQITIQPLTQTMFTSTGTPVCGPLERLYDEAACFVIEILPQSGYAFMCASVCVYLLTGFDGSLTHKAIHRELFPHDEPPPSCRGCRECCCACCARTGAGGGASPSHTRPRRVSRSDALDASLLVVQPDVSTAAPAMLNDSGDSAAAIHSPAANGGGLWDGPGAPPPFELLDSTVVDEATGERLRADTVHRGSTRRETLHFRVHAPLVGVRRLTKNYKEFPVVGFRYIGVDMVEMGSFEARREAQSFEMPRAVIPNFTLARGLYRIEIVYVAQQFDEPICRMSHEFRVM